jgi:O-acetyl-ADP-ribose deacetylase (regulator of RNase III)
MLALAAYRSLVKLDEPFRPLSALAEGSEQARFSLAERLLERLQSHDRRPAGAPTLTPRQALYAALIERPALPFPPGLLDELDGLLAAEAADRTVTAASALPLVAGTTSVALWRGDITTLAVDAIGNAANRALLGCFQPFHACIDNAIHAACGPRLRADCQAIMQRQGAPESTGGAKITRAYHLPSRYVVHTVGPIVAPGSYRGSEAVPPSLREALASSYRSCLELASSIVGLRSIALPCISTGVFGFPAAAAARIAIDTVWQWLEARPGRLDRIVFNVFSERDEQLYRTLLARRNP